MNTDNINITGVATIKKITFKKHIHKVRDKEEGEQLGKRVNKGLGMIGLTVNTYILVDISLGETKLGTRKIKFSTLLSSDEFKSLLKNVGNGK
jgi:hypothetical protein